jgi:prepilin-type N-terminal cleavage/methylation domain-containing protein
MPRRTRHGFTLIELSIVLVIIGLIVGGVLVGQDLIKAAEVRAQISQIEKYNTAVNTFQAKFNCLPGDCANAADFGFPARGQYAGEGDGNGVLQGVINNSCCGVAVGDLQAAGETVVFWVDLSMAELISGGFNTATSNNPPASITGSDIALYLPPAKIGHETSVYVWSPQGINSFGIAAIYSIPTGLNFGATIPVIDAYNIDQKIDDGLPTSGRVTTQVTMGSGNDDWVGQNNNAWPTLPAKVSRTASSCFDNGNVVGAPFTYTLAKNNGAGTNCALAFQFQ